MVVERENEIKQFVPKDYWSANVLASGVTLRWQDKNGQTRLFDKSKADQLVAKVTGQTGEGFSVNTNVFPMSYFPSCVVFVHLIHLGANARY